MRGERDERDEDDVIDGGIDRAGATEVPLGVEDVTQPGGEELAQFRDGQDAGESTAAGVVHAGVGDGVARAAGVGDVVGI